MTATRELIDRLRLARAEGVGAITHRRLLHRYKTAAAALDALPRLAVAGGRATAPRIPTVATIERELSALAALGGRMFTIGQPGYPKLLALLDDAPPALAVLGDPALLDQRAVAIVGSRNASLNGRKLAETIAADLAGAGIAVVSGLARGIDTAAHEGALTRGATIAAVAGGLDMPYPPENAALQARIATGGAVVAEAPLGTAPMARHFPRRNRVIAGLALGVVVVEAALRSGSLITARLAEESGRELFAVPGSPLDPRARGSNDLLRARAHLTEGAEDVLANLPDHPLREGIARSPMFARGPAPSAPGFAGEDGFGDPQDALPAAESAKVRAQLLEMLGPTPVAVDDILRRCHFSAAAIHAALIELDLAGRIEVLPGNRVAILSDPE